MYTSTEQTEAPSCGVCGRRLQVGFHFTCHVCGNSYCYAHAPLKCDHKSAAKARSEKPARITR